MAPAHSVDTAKEGAGKVHKTQTGYFWSLSTVPAGSKSRQ